jgi:L-lactate dehydrogenase
MELSADQHRYRSEYKGETYYFCSSRCKNAFERDPGQYLEGLEHGVPGERKVVVVGTGQVGATFAFSLMGSGLADSLVLVDRKRAQADGHAMDLNHGLPFVQPASIHAGDYEDCKDADIVVVTAGAAQKPGESRLALAQRNVDIFRDIIPRIAEHNPRILLIVSNPVDILTYVALKLSGYSMNRVIGSGTTLDTARFRYLLGDHCEVDPRNVHGYVIGEHGDSEVPVWSQVNFAGIPFRSHCPTCGRQCSEEDREAIVKQVKGAAYEIIEKKGATYYAIALALVRIAGAILRNENSVLTVSTRLDNYYDVSDVCLSVPVILNRNGISKTLRIGLDEYEIGQFVASATALKNVMKTLDI